MNHLNADAETRSANLSCRALPLNN